MKNASLIILSFIVSQCLAGSKRVYAQNSLKDNKVLEAVLGCWQVKDNYPAGVSGLSEAEISAFTRQGLCVDTEKMIFNNDTLYKALFSVRELNDSAQWGTYDLTKANLKIASNATVYEIAVTEDTEGTHKYPVEYFLYYDGNYIYWVTEGIVFKMAKSRS